MTQIKGVVSAIIFHSKSFYIFSMNLSDEDRRRTCTVRGSLFGLPRLVNGAPLALEGDWKRHPKYGQQFLVKKWKPWFSCEGDAKTFLTMCVPGGDYLTVDALCSTYGDSVFEALSNPSMVLLDVKKANVADLRSLLAGWEEMIATSELVDLMKGLPFSDVEAAVRRFGSEAASILKENPLRLMDIPRFNFRRADSFAASRGVKQDSPLRIEAAILWALNRASLGGHLYLRRGVFPVFAKKAPWAAPPPKGSYGDALDSLVERRAVRLEGDLVYLPDLHEYESRSAEKLAELATPSEMVVGLTPFLEEFQRSSRLELSSAQREAIRLLSEQKVLVLTGLPGTGKTTSIRAMVSLFQAARIDFRLLSPTGIAAKRLAHVTGEQASTIHRALGFDGSEWRHGEGNKLVVGAVIVDETSMVDQELVYRLLVSLTPETIVVFVGDAAQLPSVGPGNVLKELAEGGSLPSVQLTQIFRQSDEGDIVSNSHLINQGKMPVFGPLKGDSEFKIIDLSDEAKIKDVIVRMAVKFKARDANFQVMSPMYKGVVGVDALNEALREALNPPGPQEWRGQDQHFRVGDRVMIVKNNYKKGVYNGDVGKLILINQDQLLVHVYGAGAETDMQVTFTAYEADDSLRLAYAITAHKSQGQEFDTVIMPIVLSQRRMLQRNLLYTVVTRARENVWLLGQRSAVRQAIDNDKVVHRNTRLGERLFGVLAGRKGGADGTRQDLGNLRTAEGPLPGPAA